MAIMNMFKLEKIIKMNEKMWNLSREMATKEPYKCFRTEKQYEMKQNFHWMGLASYWRVMNLKTIHRSYPI